MAAPNQVVLLRHVSLLKQIALLLFVASLCRAQTTLFDRTLPAGGPDVNADALNRHAAELERLGRSAEAQVEYGRALNACRESRCPFQAAILNNLGSLFQAMARYQDAESVLRQAIEASSANGQDPSSLPVALVNLAAVYRAQARNAEAAPLYDRALKLRQADTATPPREIAKLLTHMAALARDTENLPRAEDLIRQALEAFRADGSLQSPEALVSLVTQGTILAAEQKLPEAEATLQSAVSSYRGQPQGLDYAAALSSLANVIAARGRPKEAEPLLREAIAVWTMLLGADHPFVASGLMNLGTVLKARRRYEEAEALMNRAANIDAHTLPEGHPRIAVDLNDQAGLLLARKRYRDAEALLLRAAAILEKRPPTSDLGRILANLGEVYRLEKRLPESRENFARGLKILNATWGPLDPRLLTWLNNYATVLRAQEEYTEAGKLELQATRIRVLEARRRAA
jgi:tetratricopeptide (TPR) repeat protein